MKAQRKENEPKKTQRKGKGKGKRVSWEDEVGKK